MGSGMGVVWGRSIGLGSAFFGLDAFADSSASEWGGKEAKSAALATIAQIAECLLLYREHLAQESLIESQAPSLSDSIEQTRETKSSSTLLSGCVV